MLIKKKKGVELKKRKISRKFCFYAIIFYPSYFKRNLVVLLYRYNSSTIPESLKAVALTEAELQPFMCRKMTSRKFTDPRFKEQAAVQHDQIMHTACIGELNAMHFKQTLNKIINLPQEHSNYTSCHELCPYDVNIARPVSVSWFWKGTDTGPIQNRLMNVYKTW